MSKYIRRLSENDISDLAKSLPVILICGPRQVGKTTILNKYMQESKEQINFISLDDLLIRKSAKEDPALFLEKYETPLIIDDFQLFIKMKILV